MTIQYTKTESTISAQMLTGLIKSHGWVFATYLYPEPGLEIAQYRTPTGDEYVGSDVTFRSTFPLYEAEDVCEDCAATLGHSDLCWQHGLEEFLAIDEMGGYFELQSFFDSGEFTR